MKWTTLVATTAASWVHFHKKVDNIQHLSVDGINLIVRNEYIENRLDGTVNYIAII